MVDILWLVLIVVIGSTIGSAIGTVLIYIYLPVLMWYGGW
jgi:hypothetical protein